MHAGVFKRARRIHALRSGRVACGHGGTVGAVQRNEVRTCDVVDVELGEGGRGRFDGCGRLDGRGRLNSRGGQDSDLRAKK